MTFEEIASLCKNVDEIVLNKISEMDFKKSKIKYVKEARI